MIDKAQTIFFLGRFIVDDGITAAQELMLAWVRQRKHGGALLKLDFAKAYDMLDWSFIIEMLHDRGFRNRSINWIDSLLKDGKYHIMINGVESNMITSKRGLSQGDSLSPFLFVLAVDIFTRMLDLSVHNEVLSGLSPNNFMENFLSL